MLSRDYISCIIYALLIWGCVMVTLDETYSIMFRILGGAGTLFNYASFENYAKRRARGTL
jgi:hypothetical protein